MTPSKSWSGANSSYVLPSADTVVTSAAGNADSRGNDSTGPRAQPPVATMSAAAGNHGVRSANRWRRFSHPAPSTPPVARALAGKRFLRYFPKRRRWK